MKQGGELWEVVGKDSLAGEPRHRRFLSAVFKFASVNQLGCLRLAADA